MEEGSNNFSLTAPKIQLPSTVYYASALAITFVLFFLSRFNYLAFHNLVELSSVAVAITLFSIGWNTRNITHNAPLTLLAISFLAIGIIDLLHTMTYKGIGIFPGISIDPPTQFWIGARFIEGVSYLLAALLLNKKFRLNPVIALWVYLAATTILILSISPLQIFPSCLVEGSGLTPFKVAAEYTIALILAVSGYIFWRSKSLIPPPLLRLLLWSIVLTIASEMAFTLYKDVFGITNVAGHLLKFFSVVLVYRALVLGALKDPFQTLFLDLSSSHQALDEELVQRRRVEKELRQTNRDLDAFVHTASHDLRTPLTVVTASAEVLESELAGKVEESHRKLLTNISNQGHHMARLLNDMLSLASVGHIETLPEEISLQAVASRAVADLSQEIETAGCGGINILQLPTLHGHESALYQLFLNLIGNALRYGATPDKPITVGGKRDGERVHLFVSDHGAGIPEDERDSIFELFYRGNKSSKVCGTGVGLASTKKIVKLHNGAIRVEETPGGGATFRVELADLGDAVE